MFFPDLPKKHWLFFSRTVERNNEAFETRDSIRQLVLARNGLVRIVGKYISVVTYPVAVRIR
jgi:hypothetical protein